MLTGLGKGGIASGVSLAAAVFQCCWLLFEAEIAAEHFNYLSIEKLTCSLLILK